MQFLRSYFKKIFHDYILLFVLAGLVVLHTFLIARHLTGHYDIQAGESFYSFLSYLILLELSLLGLYLFYVFSLQRFKEPLQNFKASAEKLGIDVNTPPTPIFGPKIVRDAANAINKMQLRIRELITTRTQLLAAISHDLRNPITRLKLRTQFIEDKVMAEKIQNDLTDMEMMINSVLNFASEDSLQEQKISLDIVSLLSSICEDFIDEGQAVTMNIPSERHIILGKRLALKRTFTNLIQNALKYGKNADVTLSVTQTHIIIMIEDNGPGIPENEISQVFQPFYRTSTARKNHAGFGLGLSIAQEVIHGHQGFISLENRAKGGLRTKIKFLSFNKLIPIPPKHSLT